MPPRPRLVAVDGPSASGKSTVVARLARTQDWVPLAEAYDRTTPPIDLHFSSLPELARIERTLLEEEANRWTVARALLHFRLLGNIMDVIAVERNIQNS